MAIHCEGIVVNVKKTQIQSWSFKNANMLESLSKSLAHCNEAFTMEVNKKHGKLFIRIMKLLESCGFLRKAFGPDVNLLLSGQYAQKGDVGKRNDCQKIRIHRSLTAHGQVFCLEGVGDINHKAPLRYKNENKEEAAGGKERKGGADNNARPK